MNQIKGVKGNIAAVERALAPEHSDGTRTPEPLLKRGEERRSGARTARVRMVPMAVGRLAVVVLLAALLFASPLDRAVGPEAGQMSFLPLDLDVSRPADLRSRAVLTRSKRYTINPMGQKWEQLNLTYKISTFPDTLSREDTRRALSIAFAKWSAVSPLSFAEVTQADASADITIGFYAFNHTDCWGSPLHPCFDGLNGELAHAFLPPRGEIHFDNHEFWVLGKTRFSWKLGVWLNDLVQVAAHEIGHALGLWHSRDPAALMHPNATYTGQRDVSRDDVWGIQRLYGCLDKRRVCDPWARLGFCDRRRSFMKKHCPRRCDLCLDPPETVPTAPPSSARVKLVPRGRVVGFRCGTNVRRAPPTVSWYKDGELLAASIPGYIAMKGRDLRIVANEFNEGTYTCRAYRHGNVVSSNSWTIRLKPEVPSSSLEPPDG